MVDTVIAGRYRLERRVGAGGMSEVWLAHDLELERTVAVKLLAADADPARFEREARAVGALSHTNICALYDYGRGASGRPFMVLEYLPGGSLDDRLAADRPLPDGETHRVAAEIAAGLAHAHRRGIVHRDLKPANVLFDGEGRAKIADFGIAHVGGATGLTEAGTVLGTAAYISPEQAAGEPATPASDVYAFGVILFRMLTGRLPFESADALALATMHRDLPAPAVSELRPDAPPLLESMAAAALAKSAADRPRDGAALAAEIGPASDGSDVAVTQIVVPPPPRRRRWVLGAAAAVAAAGVGLAMAVTIGSEPQTAPPSTSPPSTAASATPPSTTLPDTESSTARTPTPTTTAVTSASASATTTSTPATTRFPSVPTTAPTTASPTTTIPVTTAPPPPPSTSTETTASTTTDTAATAADTTTAPTAGETTPQTGPG